MCCSKQRTKGMWRVRDTDTLKAPSPFKKEKRRSFPLSRRQTYLGQSTLDKRFWGIQDQQWARSDVVR